MTKLYVGTKKGLFTLESDSGEWRVTNRHFLGDPVSMVLSRPAHGEVFAALDTGHFGQHLHRSNDNGETFVEVATPAFPQQDNPDPDDVPWSNQLTWSLASGKDNRLWCGTIPGGLFSSDDSGDSWQLNEPLWNYPGRRDWLGGGYDLPGIHSICVDPRDPSIITVGISIGGVHRTEDNGETWQPRGDGLHAVYVPPDIAGEMDQQDPHLIAQCRDNPDTWWMQHHNGIWRSTDNTASWQEITTAAPSNFGFAVACHPADPETAWFAPAVADEERYPVDGKVVVSRTRDGGETFEVLREGLPQEDAYDLVYRHCLVISEDAGMLVMGSTTGNLWYSMDEGDSWQTLSTTLPPILCLRLVG